MIEATVEASIDFSNLTSILDEEYRVALERAARVMQDVLELDSPHFSGELAESWAYQIEPGAPFEPNASLINTADAAANRIMGRGAGGIPPWGKGTELERWAVAAGIPPFVLARFIAEHGTQRFEKQENILGIRNNEIDERSAPAQAFQIALNEDK